MKTAIEALFQAMVTDGWFTASSGDVEAPSGAYAYVTNTYAEVASILDAFEDTTAVYGVPADAEIVGSFVVVEDSQGFVSIERYDAQLADGTAYSRGDGAAAKARYDALEAEYAAWLGDDDDASDTDIRGDVCKDCAMVIANSDTSGIADLDAWEARVTAKDPTDGGKYRVVVLDGEHWSRYSCDYCGTRFEGDRLPVVFVEN